MYPYQMGADKTTGGKVKPGDGMKGGLGPIWIELAILALRDTKKIVGQLRRDERASAQAANQHFVRALQKRTAVLRRDVETLGTGIEQILSRTATKGGRTPKKRRVAS